MYNFLDILKKVLAIGTIEPDYGKQKLEASKITNKLLLKELVDHFNE